MRWLAIFCFAASGAVFALQYGPVWILPLLLALSLAAVLAGVLGKRKRRRMISLVLALGVAFGACYTTAYTALFVRPAARLIETEQTVTLTLCAYPVEHAYGAKVQALLEVGAPRPVKVQLYGGDALLSCAPGDRVTTVAKLRDASVIHGEKLTTFTAKGMHLLAYAKGEMAIERGEGVSLRYAPLHLGSFLRSRIALLYEGDAAILMTALLTGERSAFDDALYSTLSETGLTHVTAVSGMHCAFLFSLVGLLVRSKRRAALVGIPVLVVFMLMVGGTPSVTRACFMLAMMSLAPLFHRRNDKLTTLSLALLILLLRNPYAAASISLQLSFAAVAGLAAFSAPMYRALAGRLLKEMQWGVKKRVCRFVLAAFTTTCTASLFTVPLAAYYFGCVSLIAPVSNLLCLPAITAAFCIGLISLALSAVWLPLGSIAAVFAAAFLDYFVLVMRLLAQVPYHAVYTANPYLAPWLAYFYASFFLVWISKQRRRRTVAAAVALSLTALVLVAVLPVLSGRDGRLSAAVLDVGQGESVLLASGGTAALVDCGSSNTWVNAGTVAANELNTRGYTTLDYLILTHYHSDHANGLPTLFSRMKIKTLVIPALDDEESTFLQQEVLALAAENGTEVRMISEDETIPLGEASVSVFPPLGKGSTNEEGLSVLCSCEEFDMLITGDMDSDTEKRLLEYTALPDTEVLVAGHHGSKYSSGTALLNAITPEDVVIPVGTNSYGHPTEEAMARIGGSGAELYRTDRHGTVLITVY